MSNRLQIGAVMTLWVATMAWMVNERVLPTFLYGDPPQSGIAFQTQPVAWDIEIDGKHSGEAVLQTLDIGYGIRETHCLIELESLPKPKSLPSYFLPVTSALETLAPTIRTRMTFNAVGQMLHFKSWFWLDMTQQPMTITGKVQDNKLKLHIQTGIFGNQIEYDWPAQGFRVDELTPESRMLMLYVGRKWRREIFSPLSPIQQPMEILEAEVTEQVRVDHHGSVVEAKIVEYRSVGQAGVSEEDRLRSKMWVAKDGRVLKQQSELLGSELTLCRLEAGKSSQIANNRLELEKYAAVFEPSESPFP